MKKEEKFLRDKGIPERAINVWGVSSKSSGYDKKYQLVELLEEWGEKASIAFEDWVGKNLEELTSEFLQFILENDEVHFVKWAYQKYKENE